MAFRSAVLAACGASAGTMEELLAYTSRRFVLPPGGTPVELPLHDEPHIDAWLDYASEAERTGVLPALRNRFVQLRFPIRSGISAEEDYRLATRRGVSSAAAAHAPGIVLRRPAALELAIHPTIAGRVPVLVSGERDDFVTLVRAFSHRNEPAPVPAAMGACIVTGFNNWDRIGRHRRTWERSAGGTAAERAAAWDEEFQRLIPQKELYQDRFIILSTGPYSGVDARAVGLDPEAWLARSLRIRREHEFTHYFTHRVFGTMRNNLLDELIADFAGLVRATGRYEGETALLCLGLESTGRWRADGRLASYRGEPPLSDRAMDVLGALASRAIENLERFGGRYPAAGDDLELLARLIFALAGLSLEEMASPEMGDRLRALAR
jgi:hypothetical protein